MKSKEKSNKKCNRVNGRTSKEGICKKESREEQSLITQKEYLVSKIQRFTLLSNVFLSVALDDLEACQHVLRIILQKPDLVLKEVRSQHRISKITAHDAILDLFAEDSEGNLYNLEIQREDTVDHAKRVRFYCAMVDSEYLLKGMPYGDMPQVTAVYISESDIWHGGQTVYEVCPGLYDGSSRCKCTRKHQESDSGEYLRPYQEGRRILYVNAEMDDGGEIAKLMKYFKTGDPYDMSQGALSKRVHYLKCEEGGIEYMCKVSKELFHDGWMEGQRSGLKEGQRLGLKEGQRLGLKKGQRLGLLEGKREVAIRLFAKGMTDEQTADLVDCSLPMVREWRKDHKR